MFEYLITVRGYELDSFSHVNNATYLNYLEQARWEILKTTELLDYFKENEFLLVVTDIQIHYSKEVKLFDELVIKTNIANVSPYLIFKQKIFNVNSDLLVSKAEIKTLLVNKKRIPHDIPKEFYKRMGINNNQA